MVVDHLIRGGHRRIGVVAGDPRISLSKERLIGYRQALQKHGIAFDPELVATGYFRVEPAFRAAISLLRRRRRPTAILSTSNHTTIGIMNALAAEGLDCPRDVSVAGIDDFEWSGAFAPRLTTAAQPIAEIGTKAVELLLGRLNGDVAGGARRIVLPPRLVERDSCRQLKE
jgi:LacI family transcriptional regulator